MGLWSPFPTVFSTLSRTNFKFSVTFILSSANALNLDQSRIFCLVKSEMDPKVWNG